MHQRNALVALLLLATACKPDRPERGCIQIDGKGHYRDVADAIDLADAGSTLTLCEDAIVESVTVDKDVTIEGLGAGNSLWLPPEGEPAAVIEGGGELTITGVGLTSTVTTFTVEAGGVLTLEDVLISQPGGWGIDSTDGAVVLDGSVIEGAALGAVHATGETATVDVLGSRLDSNLGWGVLGEAGTTIAISDSFLRGTFVSDDTASEFDGFAVGLKSGSSVEIKGGTADGNVLGVLYGEGGSTAVIEGLDATGNYFGVWGETLDLHIKDSTFTDSAQYDILAIAGTAVTLDNVELTIDPASPDNLWQDDSNSLTGHYGIVMQTGNALTIRDSVISGHNGAALFVVGAVSLDVPVTIERTVIDDNGTQGALFQWAAVTMTDVDVTNTRNNDVCLAEDGTINCNWAIAAFAASVTWTRGNLSNNGFLGLLSQEDSATLTDVVMADNAQASVWAESAAVRIEGGSISGWGEYGVYSYDTALDLVSVDFIDRDWTYALLYPEDGLEYRFPDSGTDVYAFGSTVNIDDSTFTNGDTGLYLSSTETTLTDSTFTGYIESTITVVAGSLDGSNLGFTTMGPRTLYCFGNASVGLGNVTIEESVNTVGSTETWIDGVLQTPVSTYALTGPAIQSSSCAMDLDHVTIDGADSTALQLVNGEVELSDVLVRDTARLGSSASAPTINLLFSLANASVDATNVTVTGVHNGDALTIQGRTTGAGGHDTEAYARLQDVRIGVDDNGMSGVAGEGLSLLTVGCDDPAMCDVGVEGLVVTGTGGHGVFVQGTWATLDGEGDTVATGSITTAGADGVHGQSWVSLGTTGTQDDVRRDGLVDLRNVAITDTGGYGVRIQGGEYGLQNVVVNDAGNDGVRLEPWLEVGLAGPEDDVRVDPVGTFDTVAVDGAGASGVALVGGEHTVGGLAVAGATEWGMECATAPTEDIPLFPTCAWDSISGTLGQHSGCDACFP